MSLERDDLFIVKEGIGGADDALEATDEDLAALGYERTDPTNVNSHSRVIASRWIERHPAEALRMLLTEDCPRNTAEMGEQGWFCDDGCDICGGTGKKLRDGVQRLESNEWHREAAYLIPAELLEATDEDS